MTDEKRKADDGGLPWVQVDKAFLHTRLPELALVARCEDTTALGCVVLLWAWCEDRNSGLVTGAHAGALIERMAGWKGEPGAFASALAAVGLVEETTDGLRVRGLDRYAKARQRKAEARERMERLRSEKKVGTSSARSANVRSTSSARGANVQPKEVRGKRVETPPSEEKEGGAAPTPPPPSSPAGFPFEELASTPLPEDLQALWNTYKAPEQSRWVGMGEDRARKARARLAERPLQGARGWAEVVQRLAASSFARGLTPGGNGRAWVADVDFLLQPGSAEKVLDGRYDDRKAPAGSGRQPPRTISSQTFIPGEVEL